MRREKCETCALAKNSICLRTNMEIHNPAEEFCSHYTENIEICWVCGRPLLDSSVYDPEKNECICPQCFSDAYKTCIMCQNSVGCAFADDTSGMPKLVQKQIQRGPSVIVTTINNPELIEKTCKNGCFCWNPEIGCLRQTTQACEHYKEK